MNWRLATILIAALTVLGIIAPSAMAGGTETCATGGCQFFPATYVPGNSYVEVTNGHGAEKTIVSAHKIKTYVHKYEKIKHVHVVFYQKEEGIHGAGCVDPTKMHWGFHVGDWFKNTSEGVHFWDKWQAGIEVCNYHKVKIGGHWWIEGTKSNCGNEHILIPIHYHPVVKKKYVPTVEFKSRAAFYTKYFSPKKTTHEANFAVERTVTSPGHYVCPANAELVGGNTCKCCTTQCIPREREEEKPPCGCSPPPPPPPHECEHGSVWSELEHRCVKNGYETPPPPVEAPGPNPPDEGGVGSNECYSEITGEPVPAYPDGTCPPNSFGSY